MSAAPPYFCLYHSAIAAAEVADAAAYGKRCLCFPFRSEVVATPQLLRQVLWTQPRLPAHQVMQNYLVLHDYFFAMFTDQSDPLVRFLPEPTPRERWVKSAHLPRAIEIYAALKLELRRLVLANATCGETFRAYEMWLNAMLGLVDASNVLARESGAEETRLVVTEQTARGPAEPPAALNEHGMQLMCEEYNETLERFEKEIERVQAQKRAEEARRAQARRAEQRVEEKLAKSTRRSAGTNA